MAEWRLTLTKTTNTFVADTTAWDWPTFTGVDDDPDCTVLALDPDTWVEMGSPERITVTIKVSR